MFFAEVFIFSDSYLPYLYLLLDFENHVTALIM